MNHICCSISNPSDVGPTLHGLFDAQVARTPDVIAVEAGATALTYRELQAAADGLARQLVDRHGIGRCSLVGLHSGNTVEAVIALWAILKAGAAFLPLDHRYPAARVEQMLRDSGCALVLTTELVDPARFPGAELVAVPRAREATVSVPEGAGIPVQPVSADPAYVIYTSGSTGAPKGCVLSHANACSYLQWAARHYATGTGALFAFFTSISFDLTLTSVFAPLIVGGTVRAFDGGDLGRVIEGIAGDLRVTTIKLTPTHLRMLVEFDLSKSSIHTVILGGEELKCGLLQRAARAFRAGTVFFNEYGPTETTVGCVVWRGAAAIPAAAVPIGRPIPGSTVFLLSDGRCVAPGELGEIAIAGEGVAVGYLNRVELTAARFGTLPDAAGRVYRTGDLGRLGLNGEYEFHGRGDQQVKLRGFRVELGEIEQRLVRCEGVTEAVALVSDPGENEDSRLYAFVTGRSELEPSRLREELRRELPDYMVPAEIVIMAALPVNEHGKVERARLPLPSARVSLPATAAAVGPVEAELRAIWRDVLGVENIGPNDNFFGLGGDSIKAVIMAARVKKHWQTEIDLDHVFKHPTITGLMRLLAGAPAGEPARITPASPRCHYPLSSAQERLLTLQQFTPAVTTYNVPAAFRFTGRIDSDRISAAMRGLVARHASLRTRFTLEGRAFVQQIQSEAEWTLPIELCNHWDSAEELRRFVRPFDLLGGELFRAKLLSNGKDEALLLVDLHHTITDGRSSDVLIRDFATLYRGTPLAALPVQYHDYAVWERERLAEGAWEPHRAYWREHFRDGVPLLELPTDFVRPAVQSYAGDRVSFSLSGTELDGVRGFCRAHDLTLYVGLLSFFHLVLHQWTHQRDIVVGTPVSGRSFSELEAVIGVFVNSLPIRSRIEPAESVAQFCRAVKEAAVAAIVHQAYPVEQLIADLAVPHDLSRSALFDVLFSFQERRAAADDLAGLDIEALTFESKTAKYDLNLMVWEGAERVDFALEYSTSLFDRPNAARLAARYLRCIGAGVAAPATPVGELNTVPVAEAQFLVAAGTGPELDFARVAVLDAYLEDRARRTPNSCAIEWPGGKWDCATLNRAADNVAERLATTYGIGPGDIVALCSGRSPEIVAAIFGVLKCGAAYLPLDPKCPLARLEYIVRDSGCTLVLADAERSGLAFGEQVRVVPLAAMTEPAARTAARAVRSGDDVAYLLYTSGSTGRPKGILIEHRSAVNLLEHMQRSYPLGPGDRYLLKGTVTFDITIVEFFGWAAGEGALVLLPDGAESDPAALLKVVREHRVSHVNFVPAMWRTVLEYINEDVGSRWPRWRWVMVGGEAFTEDLARLVTELGRADQVENLYGPTETTVYASGFNLAGWKPGRRVPIGRPLTNVHAWVVDANGQPCPVGSPGELVVSGVQLARGYLNRPELTHERFRRCALAGGSRAYHTGDVVRWSCAGELEYLGRQDNQVKVRGYRIELGDVESALEALPGVTAAAAAVRLVQGESTLCGYVTLAAPQVGAALRAQLKQALPEYMIPSRIEVLESFPLTSSGKIDRKALPTPAPAADAGATDTEPETAVEMAMTGIWSEILGCARVGVNDDFFALGGHSLVAVRVCARVRRQMGVEASVAALFQAPTVRQFSRAVESLSRRLRLRIGVAPRAERYPATPVQRRMYAAFRYDPATVAFNIPVAVELRGGADPDRIRSAIEALLRRHEVLRTTFLLDRGELYQQIAPMVTVPFARVEDGQTDLGEMLEDFIQPFDLHHGPLLRVRLVRRDSDVDWLLFDIHHIVCDGVSAGLLVRDFGRALRGERLGSGGELHYKDYAVWLADPEARHLQQEREYWLRKFVGPSTHLELPTDFARTTRLSYAGAALAFTIDLALTRELRALGRRTQTTLNHLLLAGLAILLSRYADDPSVVIGLTVSGRDEAEVDEMMGCFINTLPMKTTPAPEKTFAEYLTEVRSECLEGLRHQTYPFDELVRALGVETPPGRHPLFDVLFVYQNTPRARAQVPGLELAVLPIEEKTAKFDLTFMAWEDGERIGFKLKYRVELFRSATIRELGEKYLALMGNLVRQPERALRHVLPRNEEQVRAAVESFNEAF